MQDSEVPVIDLLRRLLGLSRPGESADDDARVGPAEIIPEPPPAAAPRPGPVRPAPVACPSCAILLHPPPTRSRLCPHCRQRIVVRRLRGRPAYLTEAAVAVFEAERRRESDKREWAAARRRWLGLAATVGAPAPRRARLASAPLSAAVVEASRALYLNAAERAAREARREKRWGDVGRIRREQAAALYADAGSLVPPPDDVVTLHREGMSAVLRSLAALATDAELVGARCCRACRADDGKAFRIATELRESRLPHAGCPKGLCACDWWIAVGERRRGRRRRGASSRVAAQEPARAAGPAPDSGPASDAANDS